MHSLAKGRWFQVAARFTAQSHISGARHMHALKILTRAFIVHQYSLLDRTASYTNGTHFLCALRVSQKVVLAKNIERTSA